MRIIQLSDVHFGCEDGSAVEAATSFACDAKADLVMVTGDLTLNGLPEEFRSAERWLARLPQPLLVTPGNHDTPYWNLVLRTLEPFKRYRRFIGQPSAARLDLDHLHARMINTSRGAQPRLDWSKGAIDLHLARAAVQAISIYPTGELRVIGCHHPLVEVAGSPVTGDVHRGQRAARMFCEGGVDLILTGHVHTPFAVGLPFCDGKTYAVGASTLSKRTRGVPPGFNVLQVGQTCVDVVAYGWSGSRLEVWRQWTLPRRSAPPGSAPSASLSNAEVILKDEGLGMIAEP